MIENQNKRANPPEKKYTHETTKNINQARIKRRKRQTTHRKFDKKKGEKSSQLNDVINTIGNGIGVSIQL